MIQKYTSAFLLSFSFLATPSALIGGNAEGYYQFNTGSDCSTIDKNVTVQPANAYFSPLSKSDEVQCEDNSLEYLSNSWAQGAEQFKNFYLEFAVTAIAPYRVDASNLSFDIRRVMLGPPRGKLYTSTDNQPWVQEGNAFTVSTTMTNISIPVIISTATGGNIRYRLTFYDAPNSGYPAKIYLDNIYHEGTAPLPVELLSFQAVPDNNKVTIKWITASEVNNDYFTVERSKDGVNFEALANVIGAGNSSSINNYSTIDAQPFSGTSYYKLKQTDFNGEYSYSNLAMVNINKEIKLSVYPNPTNGVVTISNLEPGNIADIKDMQGRTVYRESVSDYATTIDLSSYSPGMYFVQLQTKGGITTRKLELQ